MKLLASIGFKIMLKDDDLYINYYKNQGSGYIPYCNAKDINLGEIANFIKLKNITYSKENTPTFEYNSARLLGQKSLLDFYNMKLNDIGSAYKNMPSMRDELEELYKEIHQKYDEAFFGEDDTNIIEDIADVDRRKGKKRKQNLTTKK